MVMSPDCPQNRQSLEGRFMSDTNQEQEDAVLRRMLATKPTPHKPLAKKAKGDARKAS